MMQKHYSFNTAYSFTIHCILIHHLTAYSTESVRFGGLVLVLIDLAHVDIAHASVLEQVVELSHVLVELQAGFALRAMLFLLYCQTLKIVLQGRLVLLHVIVSQAYFRQHIGIFA